MDNYTWTENTRAICKDSQSSDGVAREDGLRGHSSAALMAANRPSKVKGRLRRAASQDVSPNFEGLKPSRMKITQNEHHSPNIRVGGTRLLV